jgi:hypothetical protein
VLNATEPVLEATAPIVAATEPVLNATQPVLNATAPIVAATEQPVLEATAPIIAATEPVLNATEPVLATTEPVLNATEPVLNATAPIIAATEQPVLNATAPITAATEQPVLEATAPITAATEQPVLNTTQPVLEAATPRTTTGPMVTPTLDPIAPEAITTPVVQRPVLQSAAQTAYSLNPRPAALAIPVDIQRDASQGGAAAYSGSATETQSAKSAELLLGFHPRLFDSSLLSGALASIASSAEALTGNPDGMPHPLFPSELPSGPPPVGSTYRGGSGIGIGLELSAILALLLTLSRIGGSSVSPREGFKLVSSSSLITERPG